jgi:hypothetical protein
MPHKTVLVGPAKSRVQSAHDADEPPSRLANGLLHRIAWVQLLKPFPERSISLAPALVTHPS